MNKSILLLFIAITFTLTGVISFAETKETNKQDVFGYSSMTVIKLQRLLY